jgi:hypothetical protein
MKMKRELNIFRGTVKINKMPVYFDPRRDI